MFDFGKKALSRGIKVIIAGAGGAAHLPGMIASNTVIPIIGVPVKTSSLNGVDSLLSIVQMPKGVPVATVAIELNPVVADVWLLSTIKLVTAVPPSSDGTLQVNVASSNVAPATELKLSGGLG